MRPTLVLVGGVPWDPADPDPVAGALASARPEVRSAVVRTGYVAEPVKAALLHGADALAYPSRYEGFGLPVLEAMASGTPVLASNVAALTELAGDAALLVDPADPDAIAAGLESVLGDSELRSRLIEAGRARAAGFPWEATARRTAEVLRSAASAGERI
jgi:glycosyltransferase involved in cell wall biosynthesis